jgi:sphinganine-1-phosphate aldolase
MMNKKNIPKNGIAAGTLHQQMLDQKKEDLDWKKGKAFCLVYYPGKEKEEMIQKAYSLYFTENALNPMVFPSLRKMENEVVAMVADLMHGDNNVKGSFTSGGTESILMAIKTAKDYNKKNRPEITAPEMILPVTAHPTFSKAISYLGIKGVYVAVDETFAAVPSAIEKAITKNTILIVASAPSYPHGRMDPIEDIGNIALKHNLLFHVDACIGGFMLPFVEQLTNNKIPFDFRVKGVSSLSIDIHKYGYAAKGASVVLYRDGDLRKHQFSVYTNWPGGVYGSSTITGSRPGGAIAASWAALNGIGMDGYLELANRSWVATDKIKSFIASCPDLKIMGNPCMTIVAFTSSSINMFELADELSMMGWHFERLCDPPGIHLTISQIHYDYIDEFIADLSKAIEIAKLNQGGLLKKIKAETAIRLINILPKKLIEKIQANFSGKSKRVAPIYGMLGSIENVEDADELILNLLDKINTLDKEDN